MIVFIFIILTITANIVPLAIFLILAIVFVLIIKNVLFGGKGMGIISGASGVARSAGKEGIGLIKSARSEYKRGW
jgi:succinate-acetate transporter protein